MTQDEIIRMAREAGIGALTDYGNEALKRFADLVAEPWIETNKALAKEILELKKKAEQQEPNTPFMEGYRIGLAEMREKCAQVVTEHAPTCSPHWCSYVVAIRAITFEGDTGFRPLPDHIASTDKKAEQPLSSFDKDSEPVAIDDSWCIQPTPVNGLLGEAPPQREWVELSDEQIWDALETHSEDVEQAIRDVLKLAKELNNGTA